MVTQPSVAVIDIGSNSIKLLVAQRAADGDVQALKFHTIDARISAGISQAEPRLSEASMVRGLDAIKSLLDDARDLQPTMIVLVATSAVRDASNSVEFEGRVLAATGHTLRILSGEEEANLIGRGLTCDPALADLRDFYVFDLGGGSLECLAFRNRRIEQSTSLQLGCVRLMEKFVREPDRPFGPAAQSAIAAYTREVLANSGFKFSLSPAAVTVGTGGTLTSVRTIFGAAARKPFDQTDPVVTVAQLRALLATISALPLDARKEIAGLPPARADVFPTALATFIALAEFGGVTAFRNSLYNLRYGLADEALSQSHFG